MSRLRNFLIPSSTLSFHISRSQYYSTMPINRITLFKIPKEEDRDAALAAYAKLAAEHKKVRFLIRPEACDLP